MKPTRILASATLLVSSIALITAAGISAGDEPGVVRMGDHSPSADFAASPTPDPGVSGVATMDGGPADPNAGLYPQPAPYAPYFERSYGATQQIPHSAYQPKLPFGPIIMFETNIGDGLGYQQSYQRLNARVPYHIIPNTNVLLGDISASVTNNGDPLANVGGIYRNYDASLNRIFGWNAYGDFDRGNGNGNWYQVGAGLESLGKYIDFRANGYFVAGNNSKLLSNQVIGDLFQAGNNVFRTRNQVRDNAYSGFDAEVGGPLPILGEYGINMYLGGYYLGNAKGYDAPGVQARWQATLTESLRLNTYLTSDKTFGTNSWVSLQYEIPNYKNHRILRSTPVRDRLSDPVYRSNRIHTNVDVVNHREAQINEKTDLPFFITYVDPNGTLAGNGTFENPYNTLQAMAGANNDGIDMIRVTPRADDTGTNLTVNGGLTLFDCQTLVSTTKDSPLFTTDGRSFGLAAVPTTSNLGPLISDPTLVAGDSVIRLANGDQVLGFRIDASNSTQTIIGTGISNMLPIEDVTIAMNTFTNYETAVNLQDVSGRAVLDMNTANGIVMAAKNGAPSSTALYSKQGLVLSTAAGQEVEVLVSNNSVNNSRFADPTGTTPAATTVKNDQTTVGISVTANLNSTILADNPNRIGPLDINGNRLSGATGILNNTVENSGDGIVLKALAGSRFDAVVENNQSYNNARNGLMASADGAAAQFNLYGMSDNLFGGEDLNANGILDATEDTNNDGVLDTGEDLNGDNILDVSEDTNLNGILDNGEDRNQNGALDLGEDTNGDGILNPGEDLDRDGILRPAEDVNGDGLLAAGNGLNGAFLHYLNGGSIFAVTEDFNNDTNLNGIRDNGEVLGANGLFNVFNSTLNAGEDRNGNGRLDLGIVSNHMSDNGIAGLCIIGEDTKTGSFTIGGPQAALGNQFYQNLVSGVGVDLRDNATMSVDSMSNVIGRSARLETFVTTVSATLDITGDTFTANHILTNTSPLVAGQARPFITDFVWNLNRGPGIQGWEIDTEQQFIPNFNNLGVFTNYTINNAGFQFSPQQQTEISTNLQLVNGINFNNRAILPNPNLFIPFTTYVTDLDRDIDADEQLALTFGNFGPSANNTPFIWRLDTDRKISNNNSLFPDDAVTANLLQGTTASVTFSADFEGTGTTSSRLIRGTLAENPNDPLGVQLAISANVVSGGTVLDPTKTGHGMSVNATGNSRITNFTSINDRVQLNKGDGMTITARDTSRIDSLTIQGANIDRNGGRGINIEAHDQAVVNASSTIGGFDLVTGGQNILSGTSYSEGNTIAGSGGDGFRVLASNGGIVNGNLINNTISGSGGNGASLIVDNGGKLNFGNPAKNQLIYRNMIMDNDGAGLRISSGVTPTGSAGYVSALVQDNMITGNQNGGIVSTMSGTGHGNMNGILDPGEDLNGNGILDPGEDTNGNQIDLVIGGAADRANTIDGNSVVGVSYEVAGNGMGNFKLENASVTNTIGGDGIVLRRSDASLLTANVNSVSATGNSGTGLVVDVSGTGKDDPAQPSPGTVNTVNWNKNNLSNNGQNGASFAVRGSAQLIADGENNVANSNGRDGVAIATSGTASFGDATVGPPPGRRVLLNGTTASNNGRDGFNISAIDNSRTLVEITSNRTAPEAVGSHSGLNNNGNTTISNNGRDGIRIATTGGQSDILITSGTGKTTINGNGTVAGGNGIRWDASGTSDGIVRVTKTTISNSIAGATEANTDPNANGDVDVADGDGIQANFNGATTGAVTATLIVGGIGDGNTIQGNEDDGIALTVTGGTNSNLRPKISILDNVIGGTGSDGLAAGNGGDGVSLNYFGGFTSDAFLAPAVLNTDITAGPLLPGGVTANGGNPELTLTNNAITNNGARGVNLLLTGAGGVRDRELGGGLFTFDPIRITLDDNTISSNGSEGIFYRADANMNQSRIVYLANFPFPNPPFNPANDRPRTAGFYDPTLPQFTGLNATSLNGNTSYLNPYQNLRTVQNSFLTVTNNRIQSNGTNNVTGEGLFINVGTGAYVAADVQGNVFGGNMQDDVRTASFLSAGQTFTSVDDAGNNTFDAIYLDDTAQLDMRFQNNDGSHILPSSRGDDVTPLGATYTTNDPLKAIFLGTFGASNRQTDLFQVDNGPALNNPNNSFINFGITQDIQDAFTTGGYNLRLGADPAFPNIGFPPFLP